MLILASFGTGQMEHRGDCLGTASNLEQKKDFGRKEVGVADRMWTETVGDSPLMVEGPGLVGSSAE